MRKCQGSGGGCCCERERERAGEKENWEKRQER